MPLPQIPGVSRAFGLAGAAAQALVDLPGTVADLNRSVRGLTEMVASARETLARLAVVTERMERVTEEMEEPILALRPGIERLARVLDDDAVDQLPDTLRAINEGVGPLLSGLRDTQAKVNSLATVLPAAGLLFGRKNRPGGDRVVDGEAVPPQAAQPPIIDPDE